MSMFKAASANADLFDEEGNKEEEQTTAKNPTEEDENTDEEDVKTHKEKEKKQRKEKNPKKKAVVVEPEPEPEIEEQEEEEEEKKENEEKSQPAVSAVVPARVPVRHGGVGDNDKKGKKGVRRSGAKKAVPVHLLPLNRLITPGAFIKLKRKAGGHKATGNAIQLVKIAYMAVYAENVMKACLAGASRHKLDGESFRLTNADVLFSLAVPRRITGMYAWNNEKKSKRVK